MARTVQLSELRTDVITQLDLNYTPSSLTHITDTQLDRWISQSAAIFLGKTKKLGYLEETTSEHAIASGDKLVTLPTAFFSVLKVAAIIDGVDYNLYPATLDEATPYSLNSGADTATVPEALPRYRIRGGSVSSSLELVPPATSAFGLEVTYVRTADVLSDDADTVDGIHGWEQWIVWDVCIKGAAKTEQDDSVFARERDRIELAMNESKPRDRGPKRMRTLYDEHDAYGFPYRRGPWGWR